MESVIFQSITLFNQHKYFTLADLLREHIEKEMITGQLFHGDWLDIGTADRLAEAVFAEEDKIMNKQKKKIKNNFSSVG